MSWGRSQWPWGSGQGLRGATKAIGRGQGPWGVAKTVGAQPGVVVARLRPRGSSQDHGGVAMGCVYSARGGGGVAKTVGAQTGAWGVAKIVGARC